MQQKYTYAHVYAHTRTPLETRDFSTTYDLLQAAARDLLGSLSSINLFSSRDLQGGRRPWGGGRAEGWGWGWGKEAREDAAGCWKSRRVDVGRDGGRVWEPFCGAPKTMERVQAGRPDGGGVVGWYKGTGVYGGRASSPVFFPPFPGRCSSPS